MMWRALLCGVVAAGGPAGARREQAQALLPSLVAGARIDADVSRVLFLGEQDFVAGQLCLILQRGLDERQRRAVSLELAQLHAQVSEGTLLQLVADTDPVVRLNAVSGLGRMKRTPWRPLVARLKDASSPVRAEAARALGAAGARARAAAPQLLEAARLEGEPDVRGAMLVAVGQVGSASSTGSARALAEYLHSSSEAARLSAARGLCLLGDKAGLAFARALLASSDRYQRRAGVALFEGTSARLAGPLLRPRLADPDPAVAAKSARILYQGGDRVMLDWLVLAASRAAPGDKEAYERELDPLHLEDDQRRHILEGAGLR